MSPKSVPQLYLGCMRVRFYFKDNASTLQRIIMSLSADGERTKVDTSFVVEGCQWDKRKKGQSRLEVPRIPKLNGLAGLSVDEVTRIEYVQKANATLELYETAANAVVDRYRLDHNGYAPNGAVFRQLWREKVGIVEPSLRKEGFFGFCDNFLESAGVLSSRHTIGTKPIAPGTLRQYRSSINFLKEYQAASGKPITFEGFNAEWHADFLQYCDRLQLATAEKGKQIKNLKAICNRARIAGHPVNPVLFDHKVFFKPSKERTVKEVYLTPSEIQKIVLTPLKGYLANARDWFVIGLNTGLRVSDLLSLTYDNVQGHNILVQTKKTATPVAIPILPQVQRILDDREGFPKKISDQKFNEYLKEVCRCAGLTEEVEGRKRVMVETIRGRKMRKVLGHYPKCDLVSSHTCRRSFASDFYGKVPTALLIKITGHATESQLMEYLQLSPDEYADQFRKAVVGM